MPSPLKDHPLNSKGGVPMFLQQLVNGVSIGLMYSLIAIGFSMVYGILKIVNFAHGSIFMVGAFLGLILKRAGRPYYLAFPLAAVLTACVGMAIERLAYRPIRGAARSSALISACGAAIVLDNTAQVLFGTATEPYGIGIRSFDFGAITLANIQIYMLLISAVLLALVFVLVYKTKLGIAMRATSHSNEIALLMGINTNFIISMTFAIGSILACVAGILVGIYYDAVVATMGYGYGIKAFAAAVLGGIGNLPGAMLGGISIGIIETLGTAYLSSGYRNAFAYGIMIIVLIFRPSGILGKNTREKV